MDLIENRDSERAHLEKPVALYVYIAMWVKVIQCRPFHCQHL